jgi:Xaa-Pro dipeptidase
MQVPGLDIHEWRHLVCGNEVELAPGMCFTDEPMIAVHGEFGVRLEGCFCITQGGQVLHPAQSVHRAVLCPLRWG